MTNTKQKLISETEKWLEKIESEIENSKINKQNKKVTSVLDLVDSYVSDSKHFLKKEKYVESFEAVIYAFGLWDSLKHMGLVQVKSE